MARKRRKRRKRNPSAGTIAVAAGAAIIAGLWAADAYAKPKKKKKKKQEDLPSPDDGEKQLADELLVLVSEDPVPGSLYVIKKGDNLAHLSQAILKFSGWQKPPKADKDAEKEWYQAAKTYQQCVSGSEFNRALYGIKDDFTKSFPSYTSPDDISIRSAFLNKSADYLGDLVKGNVPARRGGGHYGMLWLPTLDAGALQQYKKVGCIDMDPPPLMIEETV